MPSPADAPERLNPTEGTQPSPAALAPRSTSTPPVLRRDPSRRARPGLRVGTHLLAAAAAAALLPAAAALWALWPAPIATTTTSTTGTTTTPPETRRESTPEPAPSAAPSAVDALATALALLEADLRAAREAARADDDATQRAGRQEATQRLFRSIAKARDARRENGDTGAALKKPFGADELGEHGLDALKLDKPTADGARRLVMRRDGTVLAPAQATLPSLAADASLASAASGDDPGHFEGTVDGRPVVVDRLCVRGEGLCLLEVRDRPVLADGGDNGPLAQAQAALAALRPTAAPAPPPPAATPAPTEPVPVAQASRLQPGAALALALVAWVLVMLLLAWRFVGVSRALQSLSARARTGGGRSAPSGLSDVDDVHDALDAAAAVAAQHAADAEAARAVFARLDDVTDAIRAAKGDPTRRVDESDDAPAAVLALSAAVNDLLAHSETRLLRLRSHVDAARLPAPTPPPSSGGRPLLLERAQGLSPMPKLLIEVSRRLLQVSRVEGLPGRASVELTTIADAVAQRAQTAETLLDALMDALAKDAALPPALPTGSPAAAALRQIDDELRDVLAPRGTHAIAALHDLPPAEIAARLRSDAQQTGTPPDPAEGARFRAPAPAADLDP